MAAMAEWLKATEPSMPERRSMHLSADKVTLVHTKIKEPKVKTWGYNGGGRGTRGGVRGGGASDIRLDATDLNSRIIVAAGGVAVGITVAITQAVLEAD